MEFSPMGLWEAMTPIAQGVVISLIILSVWSLFISVERLLVFRRAHKQSLAFAKLATEAGPIFARFPNTHQLHKYVV